MPPDGSESDLVIRHLPSGVSLPSASTVLRRRRLVNEAKEEETPTQTLVRSPAFQMFMAGVILLNTCLMAVQTDHDDWRMDILGLKPRAFLLMNATFLLIFIAEISLRIAADGCVGFFTDKEAWSWNLFDFLIVLFSFLDQTFIHALPFLFSTVRHVDADDPLGKHRNVHAVLAARAVRILRVLRVLRIFKAFPKLRMLTRGLIESVGIVSWIMALTLMIIFLCAIVVTTVVGQNVASFPPDVQPEISEMWGSVGKSMFTLFQFLTLDGWGDLYFNVTATMPMMTMFFFPFIFFGAFVLMSLLTGVMADHMNDVRRDTEEEERRESVLQTETAAQLVLSMDEDGNYLLDRKEFASVFAQEAFARSLKDIGLQISRTDAIELFEWFDANGDNLVDFEELHSGLIGLSGGLTPLQLFRFCVTIRKVSDFIAAFCDGEGNLAANVPWAAANDGLSPSTIRELHMLDATVLELEGRTLQFEKEVRGMMEGYGWHKEIEEVPYPESPSSCMSDYVLG